MGKSPETATQRSDFRRQRPPQRCSFFCPLFFHMRKTHTKQQTQKKKPSRKPNKHNAQKKQYLESLLIQCLHTTPRNSFQTGVGKAGDLSPLAGHLSFRYSDSAWLSAWHCLDVLVVSTGMIELVIDARPGRGLRRRFLGVGREPRSGSVQRQFQ